MLRSGEDDFPSVSANCTSHKWSVTSGLKLEAHHMAISCSKPVICEASHSQLLLWWLQGMLRIGDGDMDVNYWRNEALLEALHEAQASKELPAEDTC